MEIFYKNFMFVALRSNALLSDDPSVTGMVRMLIGKKNDLTRPAAGYQSPGLAAPSPVVSAPSGRSTIGADLSIVGNLTSKGELHIEGEIQGDIQGVNILVRETARITGTLVGQEIIVQGEIMGTIKADRVVLAGTCKIEGDIFHQSLSIEQGAFFEGKSRRGGQQSDSDLTKMVPPSDGRS